MDIKTETFGTLTQVAFDKTCRYLKSVGTRLSVEFDAAVTFAVAAVFTTGDATHINKLLPLLVLAKLEPMYRRVVVAFDIIPFPYDKKECQHVGKINKGRAAALKIIGTNGIPQWEGLLAAALAGEKPENKAAKAFNLESRADAFIKAARKEGCAEKDINAALAAARRKFAVESTVASPADQVRIEENKAQLAGRVTQVKAVAAQAAH